MTRTFGGYCILEVPAKSAPVYEHQLQRNATIFGSNSSSDIVNLHFDSAIYIRESTAAIISSLAKPTCLVAALGQMAAQAPHPWHNTSITSAIPFSGSITLAS
jgi:hypothetical protein